jgi:hypothetical protein
MVDAVVDAVGVPMPDTVLGAGASSKNMVDAAGSPMPDMVVFAAAVSAAGS